MSIIKSQLKYCILINSLAGGGAERVVLTLADNLNKQGVEVTLVVLEDSPSAYDLSEYDFKIVFLPRVPRPFGYFYLFKTLQIRSYFKDINIEFDCLISNLFMTDMAMRFLPVKRKYALIHNNLVGSTALDKSSSKNLYSSLRRWLVYKVLGKIVYNNQNLLAISDGVKSGILEFGIKPKSIKVINNPFDFERIAELSEEFEVNEGEYILHVGRFDRQKRQDLLVEAYSKVKTDYKLLLLGDDSNDYADNVKRLAAEKGLDGKVVFKGFVNNPYPYMKSAKMLVLSSDFEGLPTVLIEAVSLGVPVVSTDCDYGPREILVNELRSYLCDVGDTNDLAIKIKSALVLESVNADLVEKFSINYVIDKYIRLGDRVE